jgi:hypothetical protein
VTEPVLELSEEPAVEAKPPVYRRPRTILLIAVGVLVVALAVFYGPTLWQINQQRGATLSTPAQVAGLHLDDSSDARDTADYIREAVATKTQFDKSVGAVYLDEGGTARSVIFVGGTGLIWSPDDALRSAFGVISDDSGGVSHQRDIPAGPLGGVMRCGTTSTTDGDMSVCGWADHGCLAVSLFPNRSVDEAARILGEMRGAMQRRA